MHTTDLSSSGRRPTHWSRALTLLVMLALAGCGTMSDTERTVAQGAGAGAAIGATIGALTGGDNDPYIGAVAGAVAGGLGGHAVAKRKEGYAQQEAALESRIADVRQEIAAAKRFRAETAAEIARLDDDAKRLQRQKLSQQARQQELRRLIAARERRQRQIDTQVASLEASKRTNQRVLGRSGNADNAKTKTLKSQNEELDQQLDYLKQQSARLAMIDPRAS